MKDLTGMTIEIIHEGDWFVARCLEIDIASQGRTREEAKANLLEALELHLGDS